MSTDYYLVCDRHRQLCAVASNTMGGAGGAGSERETAAFVITHRECPLRVVDEHADEPDSICYGEKTWQHWRDHVEDPKEIDHFIDQHREPTTHACSRCGNPLPVPPPDVNGWTCPKHKWPGGPICGGLPEPIGG